jgi:hypothetical protein
MASSCPGTELRLRTYCMRSVLYAVMLITMFLHVAVKNIYNDSRFKPIFKSVNKASYLRSYFVYIRLHPYSETGHNDLGFYCSNLENTHNLIIRREVRSNGAILGYRVDSETGCDV